MILDLLLVLCVTVFVIIGAIRGGIKTLLGLIATVAAFVLALLSSAVIADWIYNTFIAENLITSISSEIIENSEQALQNISSQLPGFLNMLFKLNNIDIDSAVSGIAAESAASTAIAVEAVIKPLITSMLTALFVIIVFIILRIIFFFIISFINSVFRLPVLKHFNRLLGIICGFAQGITVVILIIAVIKTTANANANLPQILTEQYIESSILFRLFY